MCGQGLTIFQRQRARTTDPLLRRGPGHAGWGRKPNSHHPGLQTAPAGSLPAMNETISSAVPSTADPHLSFWLTPELTHTVPPCPLHPPGLPMAPVHSPVGKAGGGRGSLGKAGDLRPGGQLEGLLGPFPGAWGLSLGCRGQVSVPPGPWIPEFHFDSVSESPRESRLH